MTGGERRTLMHDLQKYERDLRAAECGITKGTATGEDLGLLRAQWEEADSRLRQYDYRYYIARVHAEGDRSGDY
ncbi:hypothetical protein NDU88_002180 [Pleurodeles waltl]|uniref:Uncharacterized protein n=1 Tax=Pleurodeles waltl TaxID=8319 RepID=A0AAV7UCG3_PLEWA|nr:hypothetical protein NDU88_002180 [Pleurodeles waltl]